MLDLCIFLPDSEEKTFSLEKAILWFEVKHVLILNLLQTCTFLFHMMYELESSGLLSCFYQLFGISFWRHPFTAEDPLMSKWCNAKFLKLFCDEETNLSTCWMTWVHFQHIFIFGWTIPLTHWPQTQFLEGHSSAQFSSSPNQTHLIQIIKVFSITRNFQAGVIWSWLELNSAELRPSGNWVWDHCFNSFSP